jgi:hypothetical protein
LKFRLIGIAVFIAALAFISAQHLTPVSAQSESDQALCLPAGDEIANLECLDAGPYSRLEQLAAEGITFPKPQLFAARTPYELSYVPFSYALVDNEEVPLYATIEDIQKNNQTNKLYKSKIKYVALQDRVDTDKGRYYQIATSEWISEEYVSRVGLPNFQGYVFKQNPTISFGWVINETVGRSAPDYAAPETGTQFRREDKIFIYDSAMVNNNEWVKVGVDEWIEHRYVARVTPSYARPEGVPVDKWIEVNLYEQTLSAYENGNLVFATLISSGTPPFYTKPGVFQIYKKLEFDPMYGSFEADRSDYYYLEKVPYIMYYDDLRALHGAYWQTLLGYQRSHGCVNLSVADSHWLYDWANEGDYVYVWDPSGETPTDPSVYGSGGF